ncbi:MAG: spore coat associated protein CotJA [Oscillospiraceae bacterium]|nr:spore coat associated protein CotJA [Oscillospiraceae bacterium]
MCYVPFQSFGETYAENTALEVGTVFPDLDFPFEGREVSDDND